MFRKRKKSSKHSIRLTCSMCENYSNFYCKLKGYTVHPYALACSLFTPKTEKIVKS